MHLIIQKTATLHGQVTPPSSKSQSIRGILLALLAKGESTLNNFLSAEDTQDAIAVCRQLGGEINITKDCLKINSQGLPLPTKVNNIYSGNSGITTHFILPLLGLRQCVKQEIQLDAGTQMQARPIYSLINALRALGLTIRYLQHENKLPVAISGQLRGGNAVVDGMTSQYLSALLMALPCALNDSEIRVKQLCERPYVEMTMNWLNQQGIRYTHFIEQDHDIFKITGRQQYSPFQVQLSGDFSSASYLMAAAVMSHGQVEILGLDLRDSQGDKQLINLLQAMGADICLSMDKLIIKGGKMLQGIDINACHIPDLLPTLAVLGTFAQGKTTITQVAHARIKETDRIHAMCVGLRRMGARIEEHRDGLTVHNSDLVGTIVSGYGDHRSVMALCLAGMRAQGTTQIEDGQAINKTFPQFVTMMQSLGASIEVQNTSE